MFRQVVDLVICYQIVKYGYYLDVCFYCYYLIVIM